MYNTFVIGIGTFGSKVLVFLLLPLYTRVLTNSDYGVIDLIIQTSNLLIPVVSIGIANGVIRFGLDKSTDKSYVFSTGLITILVGFGIFLIFEPLISKIKYISDYTLIIYSFVFTSCLHSLCSQFVRSQDKVRLYAIDGVLYTIFTTFFTILFLLHFKLGITGYVGAIILSDFISTAFLFVTARLYKYVTFNIKDKLISKAIIKYSLPLIPNTIFWWITNVSDRFIVAYMLGADANGLYAISYKIPTIITLVSTIFQDAWQISAMGEKNIVERQRFFTNVFKTYSSIIFIAASALIMAVKVVMKILVSESFYEAWRYVPFLIMATSFSCLVSFLDSIYFVEKKSNLSMATTFIGAIANIILNFILIPIVGINGASLATFISYLTVFAVRALNTRNFITIDYNVHKLLANTIILISQSLILIFGLHNWFAYETLFFIIALLINVKELLINAKKFIRRITKDKKDERS